MCMFVHYSDGSSSLFPICLLVSASCAARIMAFSGVAAKPRAMVPRPQTVAVKQLPGSGSSGSGSFFLSDSNGRCYRFCVSAVSCCLARSSPFFGLLKNIEIRDGIECGFNSAFDFCWQINVEVQGRVQGRMAASPYPLRLANRKCI